MGHVNAGVEERDEGSDELPGGVFEDRGNNAPDISIHTPGAHVVRETVSEILRQAGNKMPSLWTAYASYEMLHSSVKVGLAMLPLTIMLCLMSVQSQTQASSY